MHLNSNDVTHGSLTALNTLTALKRLDLDNARFKDEGIKGLRLPNLKEVRLLGNQFRGNDDSIRALKAKLPNCEVVIIARVSGLTKCEPHSA